MGFQLTNDAEAEVDPVAPELPGFLMMSNRASLAPLTTGPPANTVSPADSALVVVFLPPCLTTVSLTVTQVHVVPSAALITTLLPLTDSMVPRSNASVRKPFLVWKVISPFWALVEADRLRCFSIIMACSNPLVTSL